MKKRLLTFLFALVAIVTGAQAADHYGIRIGGVEVTSANASNITGGGILAGKVSYDYWTNHLTLDNAVIATSGAACIEGYDASSELTVVLVGNNKLVGATGSAFKWNSELIVTFWSDIEHGADPATLTTTQAYGSYQPIDEAFNVNGRLVLNVKFVSLEFNTLNGRNNERSYLTVYRSSTLKAKNGISGFNNCDLYYYDICVTSPADGWWSHADNCMMAGESWNAVPAKNVVIEPANYYGISFGTTKVCEANAAHLVGAKLTKGSMSFDPTTRTLSLNNVELSNLGYDNQDYFGEDENGGPMPGPDQTIRLTGVNHLDELYCWFTATPLVNIVGATDDAQLTVENGIGNYHYGLNVKDCKVTVMQGGIKCMDDFQKPFYLGVDNATLDVIGEPGIPWGCIYATGGIDLHLGEGIAIREPEGGKVFNETDEDSEEIRFGYFITPDSVAAEHVVIGPEGIVVRKLPALEWRVNEEKVENFTVEDIETYEEYLHQLSLYNPEELALTYSSSNENVATIDADGTITVNNVGATTMTATFAGNDEYMEKRATLYLLVKKQPKPVTLEWRINGEKTESVTATGIEAAQEQADLLTLFNPMDLGVVYRSTDSRVATIAEDGTIQVVGYGETNLVAVFGGNEDYQETTASVKLTAVDPVIHYGFAVGDVEVTSENAADITTDKILAGKAYYDPATKTLTLDNAVISHPDDACIWETGDCPELNIRFVGENQLVDGTVAFSWQDDVVLRLFSEDGTGVLTCTESYGDDHQPLTGGMVMWGALSLVIDNCTVEFVRTNAGSKGGSLTITNNGTLKSEGFVYGFPTQIFDENIGVIQPEDYFWDNEGSWYGYIMLMELAGPDEDGNYTVIPATNVIIGPLYELVKKTDPELSFNKDVVIAKYGQLPIAPSLHNPYRVEELTWTSSDEEVATVDGDGVLTVNGLGRTLITVNFAGDDVFKAATAHYWLSVSKGEPRVSFDRQLVTTLLSLADQQWPVATTEPEQLALSYSSSDTGVATVGQTGYVVLNGIGTTTITASFEGNDLYNEASASYTLSVTKPEVKYAELYYRLANPQMPYNMTLGGSENQPVLHSPQGLALTYESSDPDVATIDADGILSLHKVGYTWITATFEGNDEWAPAQAGFMLGVQPVPAIEEDTKITFDATDFEDEDLSNTTIEDVLYTLDSEQGDGYDSEDQSLVLESTLTGDQIEAIISTTEPGSSEFADNYTGLSYLLRAGNGTMEIDFLTMGDRQLTVKVGDGASVTFSKTERGTIVIDYDIKEDTWVYVYASLKPADNAVRAMLRRATMHRATAAALPENALKLYGITIKPENIINGIIAISEFRQGAVFGSQSGVAYNMQGQRVTMPAKGLYIIDGKKVIVR